MGSPGHGPVQAACRRGRCGPRVAAEHGAFERRDGEADLLEGHRSGSEGLFEIGSVVGIGVQALHQIGGGMRHLDRVFDGAAGLILEHFGPEDETGIAAAVDHLGMSVESFVRSQWTNVELVAAALLRERRLTEKQFQSLMSRMLPEPPPSELLQLLPSHE